MYVSIHKRHTSTQYMMHEKAKATAWYCAEGMDNENEEPCLVEKETAEKGVDIHDTGALGKDGDAKKGQKGYATNSRDRAKGYVLMYAQYCALASVPDNSPICEQNKHFAKRNKMEL